MTLSSSIVFRYSSITVFFYLAHSGIIYIAYHEYFIQCRGKCRIRKRLYVLCPAIGAFLRKPDSLALGVQGEG